VALGVDRYMAERVVNETEAFPKQLLELADAACVVALVTGPTHLQPEARYT
jgi:hypothetical protein